MNSPAPKESRNDMVIFTCKDRFDDMMTCIYEAWASHLGHNNIKLRTEPIGTMELFVNTVMWRQIKRKQRV